MKKYLPILIEGAMECEINSLASILSCAKKTVIGGFEYTEGEIEGTPVVLCLTHIGMVNAALATHIGIREFKPGCVISQGTAGGHNPDFKTGDIIIGKDIVSYNSYKSSRKDISDGIDIMGYEAFPVEIFDTENWQSVTSLSSDEKLFDIAVNTPHKGNVHIGRIGTGDSWNCEKDKILAIRDNFKTDCEEMETFAAAQVCKSEGVPFLSYRVISNSEFDNTTFDKETANTCQQFTIDIIKSIAKF